MEFPIYGKNHVPNHQPDKIIPKIPSHVCHGYFLWDPHPQICSDFGAPQQWASVDPPPNPSMSLSLATPDATVKTSADNDFRCNLIGLVICVEKA